MGMASETKQKAQSRSCGAKMNWPLLFIYAEYLYVMLRLDIKEKS
jgi:hypothetical protein